ncbi:hypothetical protein FHS95_003885 [Sphingomonas naasensis]|uniref:Uncharacterized protein n=1 Tax=Sphingomonas naasensis TaxID=1344951 RepID=A0A4S1WCY3_9SPHN|nr:hypothetical protein [Sphingomonas naasensis]NIJ22170.1 hypothetical protein [Sphingomonas naasensis]TGX40808.1 hypothetical protein E5A74_15110 [Sphingomonas naasensis]
MHRPLMLLVPIALAIGGAAHAADQKATVVSAGSEQAIRLGKTVISRPFGAELVDRLSVVGSYSIKGARLHLIRGSGGAQCPARYAVIVTRPGEEPRIGQSFGTCSTAAQPRLRRGEFSVAMPATAAGGPLVRFHYANGRMHSAAPALTQGAGTMAPAQTTMASPCKSANAVTAADQARALDAFERDWPKAYRRTGTLKKVTLGPGEMRRLTADLACMASWPAGERRVPELATPLFRSKQHRDAAFAALESIQHDPATDANLKAVARSFSAEMRYRIALDPPL